MPVQVAVCGPAAAAPGEERHARRIGELLADRGAVVLCGGGGGVMAAAADGARARGGVAVGIHPGDGPSADSPDLSIRIVTRMGQARNVILVWSADAVIAVGGSWGTLSEVALAMRRGGIPVVSLGGWRVTDATGSPVPGLDMAESPEDAVDRALGRIVG